MDHRATHGRVPEPVGLEQIKTEVQRRWGTLDLLDVLKDSDLLCEFTQEFVSTASREVIDRDVLRRRLLLALFALGTNMGIKGVVSTGEHGETETALRYVRRRYITRDNLRRAITRVVNATFDARDRAGGAPAPRAPATRRSSGHGNRT